MELPNKQVVSAVHAPRISKLQEPHFQCPSGRVELSQMLINLQEHGLCQVFRFACVAHDVERGYMYEAVVPFEDHRETIRVAVTDLLDQLFIRAVVQLRIGNAVVRATGKYFASRHSAFGD